MKIPVWADVLAGWHGWRSFIVRGRCDRDGFQIVFLYAICFCLNLGLVSLCIPWIQSDRRAGGTGMT